MGVSAPSLHRESTDSLIHSWLYVYVYSHVHVIVVVCTSQPDIQMDLHFFPCATDSLSVDLCLLYCLAFSS